MGQVHRLQCSPQSRSHSAISQKGCHVDHSSQHLPPCCRQRHRQAVVRVDAPVRSHWVISEPGPGGRRDRLELCHFKPYMAPLATSADLWAKDVLTSHPTKGITIPYDEAGPFQNIIDYWARRYTSLDLATVIGNPQGVLNSVATGVILPSWMNLLSLLSATLSNHEYSMFEFEEISPNTSGKKVKSELTKLRDALGNISRTRRRAWWYIEHIHVSFQNLGYPNGRVDPQSHGHSSGHSPAIEELSVILNRFYYMKERIDSLIPIIQNACNILEAQRGALETKQFNALTSLASVFIPISTCAAIFSMGDGYLPGEANNWVFWAVALPLTTGVMLVIFNLSFMQMLAKSAVSRIEALR
ncbi:uncharacterized protein B0I36DRAFT_88274 [Microdochium trichocladiopsis]|uniref:Uncharacterized protein n=1 Tax=Microdochium trichocladiopsis TaxID=1682393 RepID=A0A9P8YBQ2_9PEZI|nr:uncharacterized protein B0I36DRAFT_88274 [Microdochium trichocladiopsis]KAH7035109.1 hypothetical protein B0I36DRAFT_88274 [Microdochium trichocladiopsis]